MAINQPTVYHDSGVRAEREPEVPVASFVDGANPGASNAAGIGINTGDYGPKDTDWPHMDARIQDSQYIGTDPSGVNAPYDVLGVGTLVAWSQANGDVAPDGIIDVDVGGTGFASINRTGKTIPDGEWTWGVVDNP